MQNYQPHNGMPSDNNNLMNTYAQDYLNTVKENRSIYGNYVDNSLTYDPYKEQKSVYNVVYETDGYNPWGKPGGGAPKMDDSGQVKTKIVGTLRWNLNGETDDERVKRQQNVQKPNTNVLLYKKHPDTPQSSSRINQQDTRQTTTYNYNYRDPVPTQPQQQAFNNQPPMSAPQPPPLQQNQFFSSNVAPYSAPQHQPQYQPQPNSLQHQFEMTQIEREAQYRGLERVNDQNAVNNNVFASRSSKRSDHELNRLSNKLFTDNQPSNLQPNNPFWFGRTGPVNGTSSNSLDKLSVSAKPQVTTAAAPHYYDARRRNLLNALENR